MPTVASPFRSNVFHFLAKLSCEKEKIELSLFHKNVNTSSHRKGNLMALTADYQFELWVKVPELPTKLSLPRQGPWNLVWVKQVFELSEVELTAFHCSYSLGFLTFLRQLYNIEPSQFLRFCDVRRYIGVLGWLKVRSPPIADNLVHLPLHMMPVHAAKSLDKMYHIL